VLEIADKSKVRFVGSLVTHVSMHALTSRSGRAQRRFSADLTVARTPSSESVAMDNWQEVVKVLKFTNQPLKYPLNRVRRAGATTGHRRLLMRATHRVLSRRTTSWWSTASLR
jgi:hypothetical protein